MMMRKSLWFTSVGGAVRISIIALASLFLSVTGAKADTFTYTYTGNDFTDVSGPYTTSEKLTGMFNLSAAIPANHPFSDVSSLVLSFTMSDGVQTITSAEGFVEHFSFSTDSTGAITLWLAEVTINPGTAPSITTENFGVAALDMGALTNFLSGQNSGSPGTWTVTDTTPVTEPGTLSMMFSGLLGLGLLVGVKRYRGNRLATIA
jgi:hypothetical protein